jgi:glutamate-5-semialdehyde dehydrogenase
MSVAALVEAEARAAAAALPTLSDDRVAHALERAAELLGGRRDEVLAANGSDVAGAKSLDEGALDRLRLDDARLETIAAALRATAGLPPIERDVREWTLANGLRVQERRVPVGVVGANFEARPNVAVDVAAQVLKSGNAVVLRTGSAALGTVTALVDSVLRPALRETGADAAAVGLVRAADRAGAEALVSLRELVPLVILRGSGASTAALVRVAAANGVRTLAHAEGGGVLYVHAAADPEMVEGLVRASLDRLGVCNRLNLALAETAELADVVARVCGEVGVEVRGHGGLPLDRPLGHEWASEAERVGTVTIALVEGLDEALGIANEQTSGLAATIVTSEAAAAERFLDGYRGTAAFWNAPTRFADGFELLGTPETGINVDRSPGPRGPVTYTDLFLRQYRVVGDGSQRR